MSTPSEPHAQATVHQQALAWFARLQDDQTDAGERAEFSAWLAANSEHQAAYEKIMRLWQAPALDAALSRYAVISQPVVGWGDARNPNISAVGVRKLTPTYARGVCALLMAVAVLTAFGLPERWQADFATGIGERRQVALADGSALTLNTDTAIVINRQAGRRGVKILNGEVYFEVKPDKARPFVVETEAGQVRVVGTRFTVKAGPQTDVDVAGGVVVCTDRRGGSRSVTAGQHTRLSAQGVAEVTEANGDRAFGWLKGRLIFQDQSLAEVVAELGRYHPGLIVIADAKLGRTRITGNYKLDDTSAIIRGLAGISGAHIVNVSQYLTVLKK